MMTRRQVNTGILAGTAVVAAAPAAAVQELRPSEGLATAFRGAVDYPRLNRALRLSDQQFVTFAQTVRYPGG